LALHLIAQDMLRKSLATSNLAPDFLETFPTSVSRGDRLVSAAHTHRPLAILDLETTGTDPKTARVVEISVLRFGPLEQRDHRTRRVNPGIPIPAAATAIHGITDADVAHLPTFAQIAAGLQEFLSGCDLCGFNLKG
jgi:DNA polymerase III epsilon subunit-like protein